MAGAGREQEETADYSDISDSEFLDLEEPGDSEQLSSSQSRPGTSKGNPGQEAGPPGGPKRKWGVDVQTPLERLRLRYLWVTDLTSQSWCEQQMVFSKELPGLQAPERAAVMDLGASLHLARELEVHDIMTIPTATEEDSWAIKLLNILTMIPVLQSGGRIREFPVFGEVEDMFLVGVIDELHYTPKGELELMELKTRSRPLLPLAAQKDKDCFQVRLYKYLFDAMVRGQVTPAGLVRHVQLRPEQPLSPQVQDVAQKTGFAEAAATLGELAELAFLRLTLSDLPCIDRLQLKYSHQESGAALGAELVAFEERQVRARARDCVAYWKGQREPRGVDVEEAWKCRTCDYTEVCEWRRRGGAVGQGHQAKKPK
ncbi:exonuclease V [Tachyglossus aculeatus]|uniref:exonuclease V n=1 Tax=Tachyglossus aculeatus TaxID=9261 RepID=UPI0018F66EBB|nr:exonuclease V [Tachyglossus aculeatus]